MSNQVTLLDGPKLDQASFIDSIQPGIPIYNIGQQKVCR